MSGFSFKKILRDILGGDVEKMSDEEFAEAIEKVEQSAPAPKVAELDKIKAAKVSSWRTEHNIGLARFVSVPSTTPCEICAGLVGKYANPIDTDFFLTHSAEVSHAGPLCLTVEPATMPYGGPGAPLPKHADDEEGNILDGMALVKVENEMYAVSHPENDDDDNSWTPFEPIILEEGNFRAGEYSEYDAWELFSCVKKTETDIPGSTWLTVVIDDAITKGLHGSRLPAALRLRGELYLEAGNKVAALASFRDALKLDPKIGVKKIAAQLGKELENKG